MTEGTDTTTPAGSETPATEVETSTPATPVNETAKTETTETSEAETSETEESVSDRPKRASGYDRMKRKNQYLQSEILRLQEQVASRSTQDAETDKAPREEDFNGDWGKYIAATAAYEASKAVKDTLRSDKDAATKTRVEELRQEVWSDFEERSEAFKAKVQDFDQVFEAYAAGGGKFSDTVREMMVESDVGPQMAYHLAKNPSLARKLNSLSPLQAAKEFGKLEDSLSKPVSRNTKAPKPIAPLNGGASPAFDPAKASMSEFAEWLNKDLERRAGH